LNTFYNLGLVLGPAISGLLLDNLLDSNLETELGDPLKASLGVPVFISIALFLADLLFVVLFIPNLNATDAKEEDSKEKSSEGFWKIFKKMISQGGDIYYIFNVRFVSRFAVILFRTHFSLLLKGIGLGASYHAYFMSYISAIHTISTLFIPNLTSRVSEKNLMILSHLILGISFMMMILCTKPWQLIIVLILNVFGSSFDAVIIPSAITKAVPNVDLGEILGFSESLGYIIKIISPFISGFIIGFFNMAYLMYFCTILSLYVAFIVFKQNLFDERKNKKYL